MTLLTPPYFADGAQVSKNDGISIIRVAHAVSPEVAELLVNAANCHDELLDALESVMGLMDVKALESSRYNYVRAHFEKARAAIAKARGQS